MQEKEECPLKGNCLVETFMYKATSKTEKDIFEYIGSTEKTLKTRFYNHTKSLTDKNTNMRRTKHEVSQFLPLTFCFNINDFSESHSAFFAYFWFFIFLFFKRLDIRIL